MTQESDKQLREILFRYVENCKYSNNLKGNPSDEIFTFIEALIKTERDDAYDRGYEDGEQDGE